MGCLKLKQYTLTHKRTCNLRCRTMKTMMTITATTAQLMIKTDGRNISDD